MIETEIVKQEINKELLKKRFRCASKTYDIHATVQKHMADTLVDIAKKYLPLKNGHMMELGCGTGLLTKQILQHFTCDKYTANDLVLEVEENITKIVAEKSTANFNFISGDAENITFSSSLDVIWSGATIQWIEDLDTFFLRLSTSLNKGGYVAISSFDMDNFLEIKNLTGKGINYKSMKEVIDFASKYFQILDNKAWHQQLWFKTPKDVLKHMRFTGVNAISNAKWGKNDLEQFIVDYDLFKCAKGYVLTYNPFVLILQRK